MKHAFRSVCITSLALLAGCQGKQAAPKAGPLERTPALAKPEPDRMTWWRDARFGMFLHWGLYSVPAGQWNGETDHAEWIMNTAHIPVEQYEKFKEQFNPVKFDAEAWAQMAEDAGMKYVVITSKHHDGFALFDSKTSDYDVMATPFQRDILRELSDAVRKHGLEMCWYHSIMDWHHPDYLPRRDWEKRSTEGADFARYRQYLFGEVTELLTNYGKIGVMWFDGEWESTWTNDYGKELYALCRKLQPDVIVNNRVSTGRSGMAGMTKGEDFPGDFGTPEQEIPAQGLPGVDWETCMTMNDHWGFTAKDDHWKSSEDLIRKLCDIASKGGNFLLNIGPRSDGTFPPEAVARLAEIGRWMKVNGESIHGTQASPLDSFPWGRCTMRANGSGANATTTLYLQVFDWPLDGVLKLDGLGNHPGGAHLLALPARKLEVGSIDGRVSVRVGQVRPDPIASVVALEIQGSPIVFSAPTIMARTPRFLDKTRVELSAKSGNLELRYTLDGSEPTINSLQTRGAVEVTRSCTVKARSFFGGRPVSATTSLALEKILARPALTLPPATPGLMRDRFPGDFQKMPAFASLQPVASDVVEAIKLPDGPREEHLLYAFHGDLRVRKTDVYTFALTSDDGSRLWIDGTLVVDNDGLHSSLERSGSDGLAEGWHTIRVEWFNLTGGAELALTIQGSLGDAAPIATSDLAH